MISKKSNKKNYPKRTPKQIKYASIQARKNRAKKLQELKSKKSKKSI